jgi:hypothetical protein
MQGAEQSPWVPEALSRLAGLLGVDRERMALRRGDAQTGLLAVLRPQRTSFLLYGKTHSDAATIAWAVHQAMEGAAKVRRKTTPLIVVPYMGPVGRRLCEQAGLSWFDLSGNAHLDLPGQRVHVEGKPNAFRQRGRPSSVFAPKSARLARWLLMHRNERLTQRDLATQTGLGKGFVSRIVRRLEQLNLIARDAAGAVGVRDFDVLLEAWREAYDFTKHRILRGFVAARTGDAIVRQLTTAFTQAERSYAATGLCAAWQYTPFAGFRLVVLYVDRQPDPELLKKAGFHDEGEGENVWLVIPNDEGVFQGAQDREGIRCVHPVQVYVDLKQHPERSVEAAQHLHDECLRKPNV